jgi:hypothetical protein
MKFNAFLRAYEKLPPHGRALEIVSKSDRPGYVVIDRSTEDKFGVELTSAHVDDRSVPDKHMLLHRGAVDIPFDQSELDQYKKRLVDVVETKVQQARRGYDTSRSLILSVYVNEYIAIYITRSDLEGIIRMNESLFDEMMPFVEVVFWNLRNDDVFSIRPKPSIVTVRG